MEMVEFLKGAGIDLTVVEISKRTNIPRRTLYDIYEKNVDRFKGIVATLGNKSNYSKEWHEYRKRAMGSRIECDEYEYVGILLLGIAEQYHKFMDARRLSTVESQVDIFGEFLWNIAELCNILDEHFSVEMSSVESSIITSPYKCIEIVREHGSARVNKDKLIEKAVCVARGMVVAYTTMNTAQDAMKASINKMKETK